MTSIERRDFLKTAAAAAGGAVLGASGVALGRSDATAQVQATGAPASAGQYRLFTTHTLPTPRMAQGVERMFKTPFTAANGMQATPEGLWLVDGQTRGPDGQRASHVYLLSYTGEIIRDFVTEGETPSGMTSDGPTLWIGATYSRDIVRVDAQTGATISKHFTPGAGVIYEMPGDPEGRRSPLSPPPSSGGGGGGGGGGQGGGGGAAQGGGGGGGGEGQAVPGAMREGTGAHGMEFQDGKLWVAVPPSRMVYRIDPTTWTVEHSFPSVHKRPHGIGFHEGYLWETDSDVATFYKRDPETGVVLESIQLNPEDPTPHGMSIWEGYIWWVDDVRDNSIVSRVRI